MDLPDPAPTLVVAINDLIFETKIRTTAAQHGVHTETVREGDAFAASIHSRNPPLVLIDLNTTGAGVLETIRTLEGQRSAPHVLAFVSHVDGDLAERASDAGVHEVLPRSRFSAQLPEILARFYTRFE